MEEATELCDNIAIMNHGKIIIAGKPDELIEKHFNNVSIPLPNFNQDTLASILIKEEVTHYGEITYVHTSKINAVLQKLINYGIPLNELRIRSSNLEDLFFELTKGVKSYEF